MSIFALILKICSLTSSSPVRSMTLSIASFCTPSTRLWCSHLSRARDGTEGRNEVRLCGCIEGLFPPLWGWLDVERVDWGGFAFVFPVADAGAWSPACFAAFFTRFFSSSISFIFCRFSLSLSLTAWISAALSLSNCNWASSSVMSKSCWRCAASRCSWASRASLAWFARRFISFSQDAHLSGRLWEHFHFSWWIFAGHGSTKGWLQGIVLWTSGCPGPSRRGWHFLEQVWTPQLRSEPLHETRKIFKRNAKSGESYHGSVHPPSGAELSNSAGDLIKAVIVGCRSHLVGKPSYMWPPFRKRPKNFVHKSPPDLEDLKVRELPIRMRPSRARDIRTLRRSGEFMNPIVPLEFDLVKLVTMISLSSPW